MDLREVREIRIGKSSKEFDKWSDEIGGTDNNLCFVLMYGSDFRLKTVSVLGWCPANLSLVPIAFN